MFPTTRSASRAVIGSTASRASQITTMGTQALCNNPKIAEYLQRWDSLLPDFGFVLRPEDLLN